MRGERGTFNWGDTLRDEVYPEDLTDVEQEALGPRKKRPRPRERSFLTELGHSFREAGAFFYKIPDQPHFEGQQTRFDVDKPFDAVVAHDGVAVAIEAKSLRKYEAFGHRHMRACQITALDDWTDRGCQAFVFINVRQKTPYFNRLVILDWAAWRTRLSQRSITKRELTVLPYIIGKKERFGIATWLKTIHTTL